MIQRILAGVVALTFLTTNACAQIVTGGQPYVFVNGTIIDATQVNADYTYIISQVNANAAKNGVNSDITALLSITTPIAPTQGGSSIYYAGAAIGTANDIIVTPVTPANFTRVAGKTIRFIGAAANTGSATLAVNSTPATAIMRQTPAGLTTLTGGEIQPGQVVEAYYDGVQYEILTHATENGGFGPDTFLAAGTTTDLGSAPGHNVHITGSGVSITSFGSSARTTYPVYVGKVDGANTLVGGVNMTLPGGASSVNLYANDRFLAEYLGAGAWRVAAIFPALPITIPSSASALTVTNNAVTPGTKIDVTAAEVVMRSTGGSNYYTGNYGNCTIDMSVVGAGGLDAGTIAANTWYYVYAISAGTADSCIASTSAASPTMPASYIYKTRLGAMHTGAGSVIDRSLQKGRHTRWVATAGALPVTPGVQIASGTAGTCSATSTWVAAATVAPSTAVEVDVTLFPNSAAAGVQPNNASPSWVYAPLAFSGTATSATMTASMNLESTNVYWCAAGASAVLFETGWTDAVNAN